MIEKSTYINAIEKTKEKYPNINIFDEYGKFHKKEKTLYICLDGNVYTYIPPNKQNTLLGNLFYESLDSIISNPNIML